MEKILSSVLVILGALLLTCRCNDSSSNEASAILSTYPIEVKVVDQETGNARQHVVVTHRKINLQYYEYLTNNLGTIAAINTNPGDTLIFSHQDRSTYYLILKKPEYIDSLKVYLQPPYSVPGNSGSVAGVYQPNKTIVNLANPTQDRTTSDAQGRYHLNITNPSEWLHLGYANDTTIIVVNAGPGPQTKLDVFFDDSKIDKLPRRSN